MVVSHKLLQHTEEGFYWLGFLHADGYVKSAKGRNFIQISTIDQDHVDKFVKFCGDGRVKTGITPAKVWESKAGKIYTNKEQKSATIYSKEIASAVLARGIKTTPDSDLLSSPHFWRGVIDGDGCIGTDSRTGKLRISLVGTLDTVESFLNFVSVISPLSRTRPSKKSSIYQAHVNGIHAHPLLEVLYGDCKISLTRKHLKAQHLISMKRLEREYGA